MSQTSLLAFVKYKPRRKAVAYRFLIDIPEIMGPNLERYGPFKKGDLVSEGALPREIWAVLMKRGAVKPYFMEV